MKTLTCLLALFVLDWCPINTGPYKDGQRVMTQPWTAAYAENDRYGIVEKASRQIVFVRLDRSGRTRPFLARNIKMVEP